MLHVQWYWALLILVVDLVAGILIGWNNSKKSLLKQVGQAADKKADSL